MSKFNKELVDEYSKKLMINLTEDENKMVLDEFEIIDENIDLINKIPNIEEVVPMSYALDDFSYELRSDDNEPDIISKDELFKNCSDYIDDCVVVPKVVG